MSLNAHVMVISPFFSLFYLRYTLITLLTLGSRAIPLDLLRELLPLC